MKTLVVFDSYFGNTEKVAQAVAGALPAQDCAGVVRAAECTPAHLQGVQMLVAGSPTRGFQPSPAMKAFLNSLPADSLKGVKVAAFDTRIRPEDTNSGLLRFLVKIFGYAAQPMASLMVKKGGQLALPPAGFIVKASEGPLADGELERATAWIKAA